MTENPYKVLGLEPGASEDEIKKKYRTLVKQYHPDLHPGDEAAAAKMSEINAAYEQIKSGNVNGSSYGGSYSGYGSSSAPHGTYTSGGTTYTYQYADVEDIFRAFFGGGFTAHSYQQMNTEEAYERISSYVGSGDFGNAAGILNRIQYRDARWYYYASLVSEGMGNYSDAVDYAQRAAYGSNNADYSNNAARMNKSYGRAVRRSRFIPKVLSIVATLMILSFIGNLFRGLFFWWL